MKSISPVLTKELVVHERVVALDQPQYEPIIVLPLDFIGTNYFGLSVRFEFSEDERKAIAEGADLLLTELVFKPDTPFTPVNLQIVKRDQIVI